MQKNLESLDKENVEIEKKLDAKSTSLNNAKEKIYLQRTEIKKLEQKLYGTKKGHEQEVKDLKAAQEKTYEEMTGKHSGLLNEK